MKKLLAFTAILALSTVAMAQLDPDPDGMGVYFDVDAMSNCVMTDGMTPVTAYICLTNPSFGTVGGWEARVTATVDAYLPGTWAFANNGLNVGEFDDLIVGHGVVPVDGVVHVLAERAMLFLGMPADMAIFTIGYVPGSQSFPEGAPGYLVELGVLQACQTPYGINDAECAWVNGECNPIANEDMTWGGVKSLY